HLQPVDPGRPVGHDAPATLPGELRHRRAGKQHRAGLREDAVCRHDQVEFLAASIRKGDRGAIVRVLVTDRFDAKRDLDPGGADMPLHDLMQYRAHDPAAEVDKLATWRRWRSLHHQGAIDSAQAYAAADKASLAYFIENAEIMECAQR